MISTAKRNQLYANLMDELKARLDIITSAVAGKTGYPPVIVRELCWLQLRLLCELIALACLVAHGDIEALKSHKVGKAYSADDILKRLERLRPHFYPMASKKQQNPAGGFFMEIINPSPLPKDDLLDLYGKSHQKLHRGSLKKMLSMDKPIDMNVNYAEILEWSLRINMLMSHHTIAISDSDLILCILRNSNDENRVQVATAQARKVS